MTAGGGNPRVPHHRAKPPGRVQRLIYDTTKRLEGRTIALGLIVTVLGIFGAYIAWASISGVPFQDRYELEVMVPADSPIVQEGDAVRIAGRLAGLITEVEPDPEAGATRVTTELRPAYAPVGRDATAKVRVKSLVYLTYLELDPGNADDPMPEGGTIALANSGSNVDLLEVVELFDRRSREALSRSIYNAGVGLAGRGEELNAALHDVPPLTLNTRRQLEALTREDGALARGLAGSARIARGLRGSREDDVAALVGSGAATLAAIARRRDDVGQAIELLRPLEDELLRTSPILDPVLDDAVGLTRALNPVLVELSEGLPELNRVLADGDGVRAETHRLTGMLRPVLRAAAPVLRSLQPTVASIDALVGPLDRLTSTLDPYARDITRGANQVLSASSLPYEDGQTAGGNVALRFAPIFTCHEARNPYPEPGQSRKQAAPC